MLNVTDRAASVLSENLQAASESAEDVLRLTKAGEGLGFVIGEEQDDDQVIQHGDRKVLVIEKSIAQALDGATIDAVDTPQGQQFVLKGSADN